MLTKEILRLEQRTSGLERLYQEREEEISRLEKELADLDKEIDLLGKVEKTLQAVSTKVLGQSIQTIDQLVTAGLRSVFSDQDLEFRTATDTYRGKTSVRFELYEDGKTAPLMNSFGGGVLCIIGVLLRITTIIILNQRRILLLDESLSHLSEQYVPAASSMLKKICSDLGFTVLMVTHESLFATQADHHFLAKKGPSGTFFEEQKTPLTTTT